MDLEALAMMKVAADMKNGKTEHPAAILGKSILGLGLGGAAGYGAMKGLEHLSGRTLAPPTALKFMPLAGAALGMAAPHLHQMTVEKMREAHLKRQEEKARGRSGS